VLYFRTHLASIQETLVNAIRNANGGSNKFTVHVPVRCTDFNAHRVSLHPWAYIVAHCVPHGND
jgi:hypothetical protein